MMKKILLTICAGSLAFLLCSKDDPRSRVIAIVSKDTLHAGDVERFGIIYAAPDSVVTDSLRHRIIQNWVDHKLILRNARERGFKLDSAQMAAIRGSIKDKNDNYSADLIQASLFLPEIEGELAVSAWDAKQYLDQRKTEKKMTQGFARRHLEKQKVVQWIMDLRGQGGFKILDQTVQSGPPSLELVEVDDSTTTPAALLLEQAGPGISDFDKIQTLFSDINSDKTDMDMALLSGLDKLEAKLSAPQTEGESKAHLYRSAESVQKEIVKQLPDVRKAFKKELKRNPNLQGQVVVRFVINEKGVVSSAEIAESEIDDPVYLSSLLDQVKSWKFEKIPAKAGSMTVNYPFRFETDE